MIIDISICNQHILWPPGKRIIADSVGVVQFSCTFDGEWDGLTKKVIFTNGNTIKEVLITSDEPQLIPHEVLTAGGLYVSAVGLADNGSIKMTTRKMTMPVTVLMAGEQNGSKPEAYAPELWEQVLAALGDLSQLDTKAKNSLVDAINEIAKNGGTISDELIAELVSKYLEENPIKDDYILTEEDKREIAGMVEVPSAPEYTLPIADENTLGGVKPVTATSDMTQPVGVDQNGRLWVAPIGSSSGGDTENTHGIVWDLVNVTSSNNIVSVSDGASLIAVLTPSVGYSLGDVTITMGGEVVTGCWNADTATVTIMNVKEDVVISCVGVEITSVDTSPVIVQYDVGFSSFETKTLTPIEDLTTAKEGMCITQIYPFTPNIDGIKESGVYDAENDWLTLSNEINKCVVYSPSLKGREAGYEPSTVSASKIVRFFDGKGFNFHSNASLTAKANPTELIIGASRYIPYEIYANGIAFTLSTLDIDDSYSYWLKCRCLPIGVREGDIIFAGKNTPYYGMANIDGTLLGQEATSELSLDDDFAQNYAVATTSVLGEEPVADTSTVYGISAEFAKVITNAKKEWMTEYGGDYRKIPIIISTDQHGRTNEGIFNLLGKTVSMHDVSKIINLGDTISEWSDDDTDKPLLSNSGLKNWCESVKAIPFSKQLNVFGNHDTWYGNHSDEGNTIGTRYPSSQAHLNQYFRNIYARRTNNNGWFTVYDDQFNVKYVVVSAFEYSGGVTFRIGTAQMAWLINELEKNDGYDVVIVSHVPLYDNPELNIYPTGQTSSTTYRISELDTDVLFSARKTKGSGTITDSDGVSHNYNFTSCESDVLCSLHGHTHYDAYLYLNDNLLVNTFDWFAENTFFFVLIDRVNRQLNIWKIESPSGVPVYQNYQIPLDKPAE